MIRVKVNMKPVERILEAHGLGKSGDVQRFATSCINRRITKYMPLRSGMLATKSKHIVSPTEILIDGPYAAYQYYGKVMVGVPPKQATNKDLRYDKTKHPLAGPFWDRRLMAAEGELIAQEIQEYVQRRKQ